MEEEKIVRAVKEEVMDEAFEKVLKYLKWMGREIVDVSKEDRVVILLEKIKGYDDKVKVLIKIFNENWLGMMAILLTKEDMKKLGIEEYKLLQQLLKLSFNAAEFNFALDPEGNILIKEDIHLAALSFDVFEEEYFAIPSAIKAFRDKILPILTEYKEISENKFKEIVDTLYT